MVRLRVVQGVGVSVGLALLTACMFTAPLKDYYSLVPSYGDERPFETPLPVNLEHKKLAIGSYVTVGVKEDGSVWAWGSAGYGEIGNGREVFKSYEPVQISGLRDVVEVETGGQTFYALKRDGTVWSWGLNDKGQLGYDTPEIRLSSKFSAIPNRIEGLNDIVSIVSMGWSAMALSSQGDVYVWGWYINLRNDGGNFGHEKFPRPTKIINIPLARKIVKMGAQNALISQDGAYVLCCKRDGEKYMAEPGSIKVVDMANGGVGLYLKEDGYLLAEGYNKYAGLGQGDRKSYDGLVRVKNIGRIVDVDSSVNSPIALDERGNIWQWGMSVRYPDSQWYRGNVETVPIKIARIPGAKKLFVGRINAVFVEDGSVYFWGGQKFGLRGTGKESNEGIFEYRSWAVPEKSLWQWK